MRGGSQACLVEAEDGCSYVAKFAGNPQGSRTLINEWIATRLMQRLSICTPPLRVLELPERLLASGDFNFQTNSRSIPVEGAFHLGSLCPVNPSQTAIFDFLPQKLLSKVTNLSDFGLAFVLDKWLHQTDKRQAIFVRQDIPGQGLGFRAHLIDHGMAFSGSRWELADIPLHGLCMDRQIYSMIDMPLLIEQALSRLESITDADIYAIAETVPSAWFADEDFEALAKLLSSLLKRRNTLGLLLARHWAQLSPTIPIGRTIQPHPKTVILPRTLGRLASFSNAYQ
jgi:hypothetical protein